MIYYIYRITNVVENKHYYGYRGTNNKPENDLGKKYFSSSTDKDFLKLQKTNPEQFKYKVIKEYQTKEQAVLKEVELHAKFDVKNHPKFYNLSNQLSLGFSANNKGRPGLKGSDNGMAKEINIYDSKCNLKLTSYGSFEDFCKDNKLPLTTFRNSYYNGGRPIFLAKDRKTYAAKNDYENYIGWYALYSYEENHTLEHYQQLVEIEKQKDNERRQNISKRFNGNKNNFKDIKIYNSDRECVYEVDEAFLDFCEVNNLPKSALWNSHAKGGLPIFQTKYGKSRAIKNGLEKYIGWYATSNNNHTQEEYELLVKNIVSEDEKVQSKKSNKMSGSMRNAKKINIYNSDGTLMFETKGDFKNVCKENNLPYDALGVSHRNNGKFIFQSKTAQTKAIKNGLEKYIGWYAVKV